MGLSKREKNKSLWHVPHLAQRTIPYMCCGKECAILRAEEGGNSFMMLHVVLNLKAFALLFSTLTSWLLQVKAVRSLYHSDIPSILYPSQACGYEEDTRGVLRRQKPPAQDSNLGPTYYRPLLVSMCTSPTFVSVHTFLERKTSSVWDEGCVVSEKDVAELFDCAVVLLPVSNAWLGVR